MAAFLRLKIYPKKTPKPKIIIMHMYIFNDVDVREPFNVLSEKKHCQSQTQ